MNSSNLKEWLKLSAEEKYFYINETAIKIGLPFQSVEKDWWVTHTLFLPKACYRFGKRITLKCRKV